MNHIISIPKKDYSKYKADKLLLALSILTEKDRDGLAMDSSGDYYEIFTLQGNRRAEQLKYFAIGFLQAYELE